MEVSGVSRIPSWQCCSDCQTQYKDNCNTQPIESNERANLKDMQLYKGTVNDPAAIQSHQHHIT
jgi:hypothetical protein